MKKKLMIIGAVLLTVLLVAGAILGVRAGKNIKKMREEAEQEKMVTPVPTLAPVTPVPAVTATPTPEPAENGYRFYGFGEVLESYMSSKQIGQLKEQTARYLKNSLIHREVSGIICTEYVEEEPQKKQITGYLQLDDNSLLKFQYDFRRETVTLMDTVTTMEELQDKKNRPYGQHLTEEERRRQEEILEQEEEAQRQAASQTSSQVITVPERNNRNPSVINRNPVSYPPYQSIQTPQETYIDPSEEQIDPSQLWDGEIWEEDSWEEPDWDAIEEEQIPGIPEFTDGE